MRRTYLLIGWGIVLLGTIHMLAATRIFSELTARALWFVSGGIAMMLLGAQNLLNYAYGANAPGVRRVCVAGNLVMTIFGITAGVVTNANVAEFATVVGLVGGATALSMSGRSLSVRLLGGT